MALGVPTTVLLSPSLCPKVSGEGSPSSTPRVMPPLLPVQSSSCVRRVDGETTARSFLARLSVDLTLAGNVGELELCCVPACQLWLGSSAESCHLPLLARDERVTSHLAGDSLGKVLLVTERRERERSNGGQEDGGCVESLTEREELLPRERLWVSETDSEGEPGSRHPRTELLPGLKQLTHQPSFPSTEPGSLHQSPSSLPASESLTQTKRSAGLLRLVTETERTTTTLFLHPPLAGSETVPEKPDEFDTVEVLSNEREEEELDMVEVRSNERREEDEELKKGDQKVKKKDKSPWVNSKVESLFLRSESSYEHGSEEVPMTVAGPLVSGSVGECGEGSDEGIGMDEVGEGGVAREGGNVILVIGSEDEEERYRDTGKSGTEQSPIIIRCCGMELSQGDLCTLVPNECLNDQVVNCYMKLLQKALWRPHAVAIASTFFYTQLCLRGPRGVGRWMKDVDFRRLHLFLVPVHLPSQHHWCLAAIHVRRKVIEYYDSLGGQNPSCLKKLLRFMLQRTGQQSKSQPLRAPTHHWRKCYPKGLPRQSGSSDCGVYICQFARWLCCGRGNFPNSRVPFTQSHMPRIRQTMRLELKNERLSRDLL